VRHALTTSTGDRSADHQRLVRACYTAGLTSDHTRTVVRSYAPSTEKYGRRLDDETVRSYLKCVDDEQRVKLWLPPNIDPPPGKQLEANDQPAVLGAVLPRSSLAALPSVHHLVRGVISQPAAGVLVGAYGLGKTILAHALACSVATGRDWLGRPVQQRRVLVVVGEGAYGLHDRLAAWEVTWNGGQPVPDDVLTFIIKPGSLRDPLARHSIGAYALGGGYGFVILDTFSSLAPDADETKDAPLIMRFLSDLSTAISGTALLVHHPGWSDNGRARGGYQFEANADEVLVLTGAAEGSDLLCLTRKKVKDGPSGGTLWLHRKPIHGSVVIAHARSDEVDVPMRERILSVLTNYGDIGVTGPQLAAELAVDDKGKSTFYKAMRKLTEEGAAVRVGTRGVQRYFLAEYAQGGHSASGTVIPLDFHRSTRPKVESTASGTEVHSESPGQPANDDREWNASGKPFHKGESSGSAPPSLGGALDTRDSVNSLPQCSVCDELLGETYVLLGRTTHPGCRAKEGGDR
jgi:hypothetical protein